MQQNLSAAFIDLGGTWVSLAKIAVIKQHPDFENMTILHGEGGVEVTVKMDPKELCTKLDEHITRINSQYPGRFKASDMDRKCRSRPL